LWFRGPSDIARSIDVEGMSLANVNWADVANPPAYYLPRSSWPIRPKTPIPCAKPSPPRARSPSSPTAGFSLCQKKAAAGGCDIGGMSGTEQTFARKNCMLKRYYTFLFVGVFLCRCVSVNRNEFARSSPGDGPSNRGCACHRMFELHQLRRRIQTAQLSPGRRRRVRSETISYLAHSLVNFLQLVHHLSFRR
jgi:hypothetical protein